MTTYEKEIKEYIIYCEKQKALSENSLRAYRIDMAQFIEFAHNEYPISIILKTLIKLFSKHMCNSFFKSMHQKHANAKSLHLKAFFNYLEFEDIIDISPIRKIRTSFKKSQTLPKRLKL